MAISVVGKRHCQAEFMLSGDSSVAEFYPEPDPSVPPFPQDDKGEGLPQNDMGRKDPQPQAR